MNNKQLYLAWLRTYSPTTYTAALRKATGRNRNLGGLTDDLINNALAPDVQHSFLGDDTLDEITVTATKMDDPVYTNYFNIGDTPTFDQSTVSAPPMVPIDTGAVLPSTPAVSSGSSDSIWNNVLKAVTVVGGGVLQYSNQQKLISLNTTRAQQGLPPVDASGRVVTTAGLSTTNPSLLAFERSITGGGMMMPLMIGALAIGAILFFKKSA